MEETVIEVLGKNKGKLYTKNDGYYYRIKDKPSANRWKLTCYNVKCRGSATLINPEGDKKIDEKSAHTCEPDTAYQEKYKLREDILKRCARDVTPSSEIFREECAKR